MEVFKNHLFFLTYHRRVEAHKWIYLTAMEIEEAWKICIHIMLFMIKYLMNKIKVTYKLWKIKENYSKWNLTEYLKAITIS